MTERGLCGPGGIFGNDSWIIWIIIIFLVIMVLFPNVLGGYSSSSGYNCKD